MKTLFTVSPTEEISKELVDQFCQLGFKEASRVDYKREFPRDLAKHVAAFANTFGGLILLGVETDDRNKPVLPVDGMAFDKGMEERVLQICTHAIHPPVWAAASVVKFHDSTQSPADRCVVVIRVEESDATPHAVDGNEEVYLRTGNMSQPFRRATVDDIQELLTRRKASVERRTSLLARFRDRVEFFRKAFEERMKAKTGSVSIKDYVASFVQRLPTLEIVAVPTFPKQVLVSSADLKAVVERFSPYRVADTGSWMLLRGSWRAAQDGFIHYSEIDFLQFAEANLYGLYGYCEGNIADSEFLLQRTANPALGLDAAMLIDPFSLRSAILGVLLVLPKFYEKLSFWGKVQLLIRVRNADGYRLVDRNGLTSPVCPDSEILWSGCFYVQELMETLESYYPEIVHYIHSAFGWEGDITSHLKKEIERAGKSTPSLA